MSSTNLSIQLLYGKPISFKDICLIYPPTLGDLAEYTLDKFYKYAQILTVTPSAIKELELDMEYTPLAYLIFGSLLNPEFKQLVEQAFFFFLREQIFIVTDTMSIQIGSANINILQEKDFDEFQKIIRTMCCLSDNSQYNYNPANKKAEEIAEKLRKGRERAENLRAKKNSKNAPDFSTLISCVAAQVSGLNLLNIWDMTYYGFYDQLQRMQMIEEYDITLRSAMAGAKIPKEKLKLHWMRPVSIGGK